MIQTEQRRPAFTLIELLTVIAIIAFLATLTALYFPNFQDRQTASRGADQLSGWLLIAKQQAKRDGLPTGIRFNVNQTTGFCTDMVYVQQPDSIAVGAYTGFRTVPVPPPPAPQVATQFIAQLSLPTGVFFGGPSPPAETQVSQGDYLEVYGGGVLHRIASVQQPPPGPPPGPATSVELTLEVGTPDLQQPAGLNSSSPQPTNYRIIRQPRPINGEATLTLPTNVGIDFNSLSLNVPSRTDPVLGTVTEVLFAPSGALVGQGTGSAQVVFWVRDITKKNTGDLLIGNPSLISVQPRTGFIASHPVASGTDPYLLLRDGNSSGL